MSNLATQTQQEPRKPRPLGRKLQQAISLMLDGTCKSQKAVCERLKLSESYLSRSLRTARAQAFIAEKTAQTLRTGAMPATATILRLAENANSEHVRLDAAKHVLALNGHSPPKEGRGLTINAEGAGYIVVLAGPNAEALEGEVRAGVGGVLIGRAMTDEERRDGFSERGRDMLDVTPEREA